VPRCVRNPLYQWTHLELSRQLGIGERLDGASAERIWRAANARLADPAFSARGLLHRANYRVVCTTDDPADDLADHARCAGAPFRVLPTWRPDRAWGVDDPASWNAWLDRLGAAAGMAITTMDDLRAALAKRQAFFHARGCRLSDHGIETVYAESWTEADIAATFRAARAGIAADPAAYARFASCLLHEGAIADHALGWVQQFHIGPIRNLNTRLRERLGADAGCDAIGDASYARPLARFLDRLDRTDQLGKTILYNINSKDDEVLACLANTFQDGRTPGKIQFGSAWWFHDQLSGMERQLDVLSNLGLLSRFVGMLTDSRSFLSSSRHEWFRRLLCRIIGRDVAMGLLPDDRTLLDGLVADICHRNAEAYFAFDQA
jgi:glucuronate isomerase